MAKLNSDELYQEYLAKVYHQRTGYLVYSPEEKTNFSKQHICTTYGELLYPGVKEVIENLALQPDDILLDLGSGLGKFALQIFMQSTVRKVIGIEGSLKLHEQAQKALALVKSEHPYFWADGRELVLMHGNFLDLDWQDANIVYMCSTSFSPELMLKISEKVNSSPTVKTLLSLRAVPDLRLPLKKVITVECSWDTVPAHIYA